jgi:hypothetical protein
VNTITIRLRYVVLLLLLLLALLACSIAGKAVINALDGVFDPGDRVIPIPFDVTTCAPYSSATGYPLNKALSEQKGGCQWPEPVSEETPPPPGLSGVNEGANSGNPDGLSGLNIAELDMLRIYKDALPGYADFRGRVYNPGDDDTCAIRFGAAYPQITLLRAVGDDVIISATYYPLNGESIDLLPLLGMAPVTVGAAGIPADHARMLQLRGVNTVDGELLSQNMYAVALGAVEEGSYLVFKFSDDPELEVNSGGLVVLSGDTDPWTKDLTGALVTNPTYIPEG